MHDCNNFSYEDFFKGVTKNITLTVKCNCNFCVWQKQFLTQYEHISNNKFEFILMFVLFTGFVFPEVTSSNFLTTI